MKRSFQTSVCVAASRSDELDESIFHVSLLVLFFKLGLLINMLIFQIIMSSCI